MKANFRADDPVAQLQISVMKPNHSKLNGEGFHNVVSRHTRAIKSLGKNKKEKGML
jgi:hypothetical protein